MKYMIIVLTSIFTSCSLYTDISFRSHRKEIYSRGDGFMISCRKDGIYLIVGTYTPESWGADFYYQYLDGKPTERELKITALDLLFMDTADTVILHEIRNGRDFFYTSTNLEHVIDSNKRLKISVHIKDLISGQSEIKEFILIRRKRTYSTGTFPHA